MQKGMIKICFDNRRCGLQPHWLQWASAVANRTYDFTNS
jgi:hypothetical protein